MTETGNIENSDLGAKRHRRADEKTVRVSSIVKQTDAGTGSVVHSPLYALVVYCKQHAILKERSPDRAS